MMTASSDTHQLTGSNTETFVNEAFVNDEQPPPPYASVYSINVGHNSSPTSLSTCALQMSFSIQQPASYDELFQSNCSTNSPFFSNLVQNINEIRARNNQPLIYDPSVIRSKLLTDNLNKHFTKDYLRKHMQIVLLTSFLLIIFQMYLIEYRIMYSSLASGVWAGSFNLFTFVVAMITSK